MTLAEIKTILIKDLEAKYKRAKNPVKKQLIGAQITFSNLKARQLRELLDIYNEKPEWH